MAETPRIRTFLPAATRWATEGLFAKYMQLKNWQVFPVTVSNRLRNTYAPVNMPSVKRFDQARAIGAKHENKKRTKVFRRTRSKYLRERPNVQGD